MRKRIITLKASSLLIIALLFSSCDKHGTEINSSDEPLMSGVQVISESEAINTLYSFLSKQDNATRGSAKRIIKSVETHYSDRLITRSGNPIPDAYLVNFADNAGFAVLGANNLVDPVIFMIDEGSANWDTILSSDTKNTDAWITKDNILSLCFSTALRGRDQPIDTSDNPASEEDTTGNGGNDYLLIQPKTTLFPFNQTRSYCHKNNGGFVISGCASVAQAIIVAYNEFPYMHIDGELIDFDASNDNDGDGFYFYCRNTGRNHPDSGGFYLNKHDYFYNDYTVPNNLTHEQMEAVVKSIDPNFFREFVYQYCDTIHRCNTFRRTMSKLVSAMFYNTNNITESWTSTGTMPSAVKNAMENLGYTNITTNQTSSINYEQKQRIISMLNADKPVIMCGWSLLGIDTSHYWVIDGYRTDYSPSLIHCNWGWSGVFNGWFSVSCIRYTEGVIYDNTDTTAANQHTTSGWGNLITYTYDIPTTNQHYYCFPSSNYKTLYVDPEEE